MNDEAVMDAEAAGRETRAGLPFLPDPMLIWQIFRRNLHYFASAVLGVLGLVLIAYLLQDKLYRADASLLIAPADTVLRTPELNQPQSTSTDDRSIDTQIRLISSPIVAQLAASSYATQTASPDDDAWTEEEIASIASRMERATNVYRVGDTRVITVEATSEDPEFSAATANLVSQSYISWQLEGKQAEASGANAFLKERLAELEEDALQTQAAVDRFKVARGLMSAQGATIAEQEVSTLNQQLASARAELAEKQGRLNAARGQISRGGGGADVGQALGSDTVRTLRAQEAAASSRLAVLQEKYGPLHPERRQVESELRDIRQRIQEEINRVMSSLQAEVATAQSRVASLSASRSSATGALAANGRAQAGLNELQQKADAARTIYENFLARSKETAALEFAQMPDAKLAESAIAPNSPVSPDPKLYLLFGLIGALAAGGGAVGLSEYLRAGIVTKRDVQQKLGLRYAGAIPTLESSVPDLTTVEAPHDYVIEHPQSLFAEAFRSIRAFLLLSAKSKSRAIAIVSALPREGKSTSAVCLGRVTAAEGRKTVLVDTDLRRMGSSEILGVNQSPGLVEYLAGEADLDEALFHDETSGLDVLGLHELSSSPVNHLTEENIERMLAELRERYDVIVVDTAPVLGVAEARLVARLCDRVLLVCEWKKTSANAVNAVVDILQNSNAVISGLALTQVDIRKYASTGDGDVYGYRKKFRGYYVN